MTDTKDVKGGKTVKEMTNREVTAVANTEQGLKSK